MERDKRDFEEVKNIIGSQMDMELKRKKSDYIIENNGSMEELDNEIEKFVRKLEEIVGKTN